MASAYDPFLPALPVSWTKSSRLCGSPQLIILAISGISIPNPKALLAFASLKHCPAYEILRNSSSISFLNSDVEAPGNNVMILNCSIFGRPVGLVICLVQVFA